MAFKKKKSSANVVVGKQERFSARLKRRIQDSTKRQRLFALGGIVCAIVLAVSALYVYGEITSSRIGQGQNTCAANQKLLTEASEQIQPDRRSELASSITEIEKYSDHESDPNCLIPLTVYYIHKADIEKAATYYTKLEENYNEDRLYGFFKTTPSVLENLKAELEGMKMRIKEAEEGTLYFSEYPL